MKQPFIIVLKITFGWFCQISKKTCLGDFVISKIKDMITPYNCLLKNANFSVKTNNDKITCHLSLTSQFTVVLNGIICFSVRFCNNSLLVLKMLFQFFSFASKKIQEDVNVVVIIVISSTKPCLSFLKF